MASLVLNNKSLEVLEVEQNNLLKKNQDCYTGKIIVNPANTILSNSYNEGVRINQASNGWSNILFGAPSGTTTGAGGGWLVGRRGENAGVASIGDFSITYNTSIDNGLVLKTDGSNPLWYGKRLATESSYAYTNAWNVSTISSGNAVSTSLTITTSGRPVFIAISYCNQSSGGNAYWGTVALYRGSTHLKSQTNVSSSSSYNTPGCIIYLDIVPAGTYTYNFYIKCGSGTIQLNETNLYGDELPSIAIFEI